MVPTLFWKKQHIERLNLVHSKERSDLVYLYSWKAHFYATRLKMLDIPRYCRFGYFRFAWKSKVVFKVPWRLKKAFRGLGRQLAPQHMVLSIWSSTSPSAGNRFLLFCAISKMAVTSRKHSYEVLMTCWLEGWKHSFLGSTSVNNLL